jgi:hypothetical protein
LRVLSDDSTWVKMKFISATAVPILNCLDEVALDSTSNVNLEFRSSSRSAARLIIVSSSSLSFLAAVWRA